MENNANVEKTGAENQENNNADQNGTANSQENQNAQETQQPTPAEIAAAYLKEQGFEFESIDDLKKTPEKIVETVEVNPYEEYLDEDDKAYFNYRKETGRSRQEFESLKTNFDEIPRIQLAREKIRKESGLSNLSDAKADEYLAETLNIDLEEMSSTDEIKLAQFTKSILEEKKEEQEKYRKPIENKQNVEHNDKQEYVRLNNGAIMLKSEYDNLENNRQKEINSAKEAVNSVTALSFEVSFDDNGTERKETFAYDIDDKDRHSMVSIVSDIDGVMASRYQTDQGFNHKQFAEDMFWSDPKNREKAIASIVHKAVAKNTEEVMKQRGNVNLTPHNSLQTGTKDGVKIVSVQDALKGKI